MSLASQVSSLATRIATEIKAVRSEIKTPVFVQETEPIVSGPAVWYQTDGSGNVIKKWIQTS